MAGAGFPQQPDVLHPLLNPSVSAKAVPVVVTLFDAVFDGSNFQREVGPDSVVTLNQLLHGLVVVVRSQRHQCEHRLIVVAQPLHGARIALCTTTQRHQFRKPLVDEPRPRLGLVVHCMNKEAKLWIAVAQEPVSEFAISRNGFAPSDQYFRGILPCHD